MLKRFYSVNIKEGAEFNDKLLYSDYNIQRGKFKEIPLEPMSAYRHQGNFYSLLSELNIEKELFTLVLKANNLNSPYDFNGTLKTIVVPDKSPIPKV